MPDVMKAFAEWTAAYNRWQALERLLADVKTDRALGRIHDDASDLQAQVELVRRDSEQLLEYAMQALHQKASRPAPRPARSPVR